MNGTDYIGKQFKSILGFVVTVESYIEAFNFGGIIGTRPALQCRIFGNESAQHAIYPLSTFDFDFKPYVKPEPKPVAPKPEPPAGVDEPKAQ